MPSLVGFMGFAVAIAQGNIEYVERFTYLGSVISSDGDVEADINA